MNMGVNSLYDLDCVHIVAISSDAFLYSSIPSWYLLLGKIYLDCSLVNTKSFFLGKLTN